MAAPLEAEARRWLVANKDRLQRAEPKALSGAHKLIARIADAAPASRSSLAVLSDELCAWVEQAQGSDVELGSDDGSAGPASDGEAEPERRESPKPSQAELEDEARELLRTRAKGAPAEPPEDSDEAFARRLQAEEEEAARRQLEADEALARRLAEGDEGGRPPPAAAAADDDEWEDWRAAESRIAQPPRRAPRPAAAGAAQGSRRGRELERELLDLVGDDDDELARAVAESDVVQTRRGNTYARGPAAQPERRPRPAAASGPPRPAFPANPAAAKRERLAALVKRTDEYVRRLTASLAARGPDERRGQTASLAARGPSSPPSAPSSSTTPTGDAYYAAAHAVQEEVACQPAGLGRGADPPLQLREHQMFGLRWLASLHANGLDGILADEMGLGKTIQAIALLVYLAEGKGLDGPHLVVAPLSTLHAWGHELARWAPGLQALAHRGEREARRAALDDFLAGGGPRVLLTTYEVAIADAAALGRPCWHYLIVDEAQRLKNARSRLAAALSSLSVRRRLLLSGTPLQNNLGELWALLNFTLPGLFGPEEEFYSWFEGAFESGGALSAEERLLVTERLHGVLRPFLLRRRLADVPGLQVPEKSVVTLRCPMSALQRRLYAAVREGAPSGALAALSNALMQLRKVCNHPFLLLDEYEIDDALVRASGKLAVLDALAPVLRRFGHRLLVFSQMTSVLDVLEEWCGLRGYPLLRLDGRTKAEERGGIVAEFSRPGSEAFVFLLSTRAGGVGLNLQAADTVVLYDVDWNPHSDAQAEARAHRLGQERPVLVLRLLASDPGGAPTVEEAMAERAEGKLLAERRVIGAGGFDHGAPAAAGERRRLLEELLRRDRAPRGCEAEAAGGGFALESVARSEAEAEALRAAPPPRAMGDDESAAWVERHAPEWAAAVSGGAAASSAAAEPAAADLDEALTTRSGKRARGSPELAASAAAPARPKKRRERRAPAAAEAAAEAAECALCGAPCGDFEALQVHLLTECAAWSEGLDYTLQPQA